MSGGDGALDKYWAALKETYQREYSEVAADHMVFPRNTGDLIEHDSFGIINDENDEIMSIWLKIDKGTVTNAAFATDECLTCTACGSIITELVRGKTLTDALLITPDELATNLGGLPEEDLSCARLAVDVLHAAIQDYQGQSGEKS